MKLSNSNIFQSIKHLIENAKQNIVRNINTTMLLTYFEIGRIIYKDEEKGRKRADYAKETLKNISGQLTSEFGIVYSWDNLQWMRKFFITY